MTPALFLTVTVLCSSLAFLLGYLTGRERDETREQAWAQGFAAGLAKADSMYPFVRPIVNRWEMR
jgi:branched-subunit amino acid permease